MAFNSFLFVLLIIPTFFAYYWVRGQSRWIVLLSASLVFYAAARTPHLLTILAFVILVAYFFGLQIQVAVQPAKKNWLLAAGIVLLLLPLFTLRYLPVWFSYPGFLSSNLLIPQGLSTLGVSFFSFQAISYLIDILLEISEPEKHLGYFALYLSFFPKLIQGPIERSGNLLPQLRQPAEFDYENIRSGLIQIAWGLFQKVVLAERLAVFVNLVYDQVSKNTGLSLILATYLYAFQIYFDFSGYTDMALGIARLFNIQLTPNFNSPYMADSVADFWRRWHITFSRWILDYIFKPLQMAWRSWRKAGVVAALLITFFVSGLWHGPTSGFIIWGLLHGIYLSIETFTSPIEKKWAKRFNIYKNPLYKGIKIFFTFNLICLGWIFFRANTFSDAWYILTHLTIFNLRFTPLTVWTYAGFEKFLKPLLFGRPLSDFLILLGLLGLTLIIAIIKRRSPANQKFQWLFNLKPLIRWSFYYLIIILTFYFGIFETRNFIYNQF